MHAFVAVLSCFTGPMHVSAIASGAVLEATSPHQASWMVWLHVSAVTLTDIDSCT